MGNATLHVPEGSVEQYGQTATRNEFGNIVVLTEEEITGIQNNPSDEPITRYFNLSGNELDAPGDGVTIVLTTGADGKQQVTKKVMK